MISDKQKILAAYMEAIEVIADNSALEDQRAALQKECENFTERMNKMIEGNARSVADQKNYSDRYNTLAGGYDIANKKLLEVTRELETRKAKRLDMLVFIRTLGDQDKLLTVFDGDLCLSTVRLIKVLSKSELLFVLKDDSEIPWTI